MATQMKDSGIPWIGQIPKHWEVCRLKTITPVKRGASPRPIDDAKYFDDNGEFSWVRIADVTASDMYLVKTTQKLSTLGSSLSVKRYPGDIFVSIAGTVGKPIITKIKCCIHDGFVYFPSIRGNYNISFLYYLFKSERPYLGLGKLGTQLNLNTEIIGNIFIPIPPLTEQEAIATYLDGKCKEIDELVAIQERMIEELKAYRQSVITEAVTKGLNPNAPLKDSNIPWIGQIPRHWEICKLKTKAEKRTENPMSYTKYIGLENVESFSGHYIETNSQYDISQSNSCLKDDVIFGKLRPYLAKAMVLTEDCCCSAEFLVLKGFENSKYLRYILVSNWFIEIVNASTYGAKMPRANANFILNMMIAVPSPTEQEEIALYLDGKSKEIDELISIKQKKIAELKEFKKSMIYEYVTGKKQVPLNY